MKIIEYEEIQLLKQSEKSTVLLVREPDTERVFVQKRLKGQLPIYSKLQACPHPFLPKLYEVIQTDDATTIIEEYIEGQSLGNARLSEKQIVNAIKELCTVLEFLHGKDIIHRDIKPSNIIFAADGHIRLIDFDAARMPKDDLERDTRLLGTRGYAPPEQYGFAQTDARTDIYSLGVTLDQLLGEKAHKPRYRRMIGKCTNLDPDQRYQSARQVKGAFSQSGQAVLYSLLGLVLAAALWYAIPLFQLSQQEQTPPVRQPVSENAREPVNASVPAAPALAALPAPENPHWNGETGIAVFGNVPESGNEEGVLYRWRLYRTDTAASPELDRITWGREGKVWSGWDERQRAPAFLVNLTPELWRNGYYHFAVSAVGNGVDYADSEFVLSDVFEYTGENAPPLPAPTELAWKLVEDDGLQRFASWSNLSDYADTDSFYVCFYNQSGAMVAGNVWTKKDILSIGHGGVWFDTDQFAKAGDSYRFTVQVQTSRPNEYASSLMPHPAPEEYFSPWYTLPQQSEN